MQNRRAIENPKPPIYSRFKHPADGTPPATATAAVGKKPGFRASQESSSALEFEQCPPENLLRIACQNPPPGADELPLSNLRRPNLPVASADL
jgi:hypothetical protein